jgi:D-alanyl-D-alanine dipeptidase
MLLVPTPNLGFASAAPAAPMASPAQTFEEAGLLDIRSLVPDISLDMRYAGSDNFTGAPVDGYAAPRCYLRHAAAQALQRVEHSLRAEGLRLHLFDCYRPMRAVAQFVRWAEDGQDQRTKSRYYPNLPKAGLLGEYIAPVSGHSRGAAVDLTLLECDAGKAECKPLDMGTTFDFFDPRANTDDPSITSRQRDSRQRLLRAMAAQGFANYPQEWWHYSFATEPSQLLYDVPID